VNGQECCRSQFGIIQKALFVKNPTQEWNSPLLGENLEARSEDFTSNAAQGNIRVVVRNTE